MTSSDKSKRDNKAGRLPHQRFKRWFDKMMVPKSKETEVLLDDIESAPVYDGYSENEDDDDDVAEEEARRERARAAAELDGKSGHYMKKHVTVSVVAGAKHLWTYREKVKLSKRKKGKKGDVEVIAEENEEEEEEEELDEDGNVIENELDQDNDEGYEQITPDEVPVGSLTPSLTPAGPSGIASTRTSFTGSIPGPVDVPGVAAPPSGNAFSGMAAAPAGRAVKAKPGPPGGKPAAPPPKQSP